ncbi:hypothetical protein OC845_001726, partial [Tilletia horrida]
MLVRVNLGAGKYSSQGSPSRTSPTTTIPFSAIDSTSPIHTHTDGSPRPETHSLTNTKLLLLPSKSIWRPHKRLSLTGPQIAHSFKISSYHYYSEDRSDAKPRGKPQLGTSHSSVDLTSTQALILDRTSDRTLLSRPGVFEKFRSMSSRHAYDDPSPGQMPAGAK